MGVGGVVRSLLLIGLFASCQADPAHRAYDSAEDALSAQDWSRAADLWYRIHLSEAEKTPRPYLETARALYRSGDHESACEMVRDGLDVHPAHPGLLSFYASMLEELGFQRSAEMYYSRLVEAEPDSPAAWLGLGRVRMGLGHELAAESALRRTLLLEPESAEAHEHLAEVCQVSNDLPQAFDHYTTAIELGTRDISFYLDAAAITIEEQVLTERPEARASGLKWAQSVLERDPQSTCAHFLKAVHLELSGDSNGALLSFLRAVETDPSCVQALTRLAQLFAERGDELRTEEMATRALEIERDPVRRDLLVKLLNDS